MAATDARRVSVATRWAQPEPHAKSVCQHVRHDAAIECARHEVDREAIAALLYTDSAQRPQSEEGKDVAAG